VIIEIIDGETITITKNTKVCNINNSAKLARIYEEQQRKKMATISRNKTPIFLTWENPLNVRSKNSLA